MDGKNILNIIMGEQEAENPTNNQQFTDSHINYTVASDNSFFFFFVVYARLLYLNITFTQHKITMNNTRALFVCVV